MVNRDRIHASGSGWGFADGGADLHRVAKIFAATDGPQQQYIVRVDHRGVCRVAMCSPSLAVQVELAEPAEPSGHVTVAAEPDEPIRPAAVGELADHVHAARLLG